MWEGGGSSYSDDNYGRLSRNKACKMDIAVEKRKWVCWLMYLFIYLFIYLYVPLCVCITRQCVVSITTWPTQMEDVNHF